MGTQMLSLATGDFALTELADAYVVPSGATRIWIRHFLERFPSIAM